MVKLNSKLSPIMKSFFLTSFFFLALGITTAQPDCLAEADTTAIEAEFSNCLVNGLQDTSTYTIRLTHIVGLDSNGYNAGWTGNYQQDLAALNYGTGLLNDLFSNLQPPTVAVPGVYSLFRIPKSDL